MSDCLWPHGPPRSPGVCLFMSIEWVMLSKHLMLCHPHLLLMSIFPSISIFSNESPLHIRWPKYWSFSFSIGPVAPHSSTLAWKIPWMEEPGRLQSIGSLRIRHDWATSLSLSLPMNIQGRLPLEMTGLILLSKGLSRVFSNTAFQKHQFLNTLPSLWFSSHIHINHMYICVYIHINYCINHSFDYTDICWQRDVSAF